MTTTYSALMSSNSSCICSKQIIFESHQTFIVVLLSLGFFSLPLSSYKRHHILTKKNADVSSFKTSITCDKFNFCFLRKNDNDDDFNDFARDVS